MSQLTEALTRIIRAEIERALPQAIAQALSEALNSLEAPRVEPVHTPIPAATLRTRPSPKKTEKTETDRTEARREKARKYQADRRARLRAKKDAALQKATRTRPSNGSSMPVTHVSDIEV